MEFITLSDLLDALRLIKRRRLELQNRRVTTVDANYDPIIRIAAENPLTSSFDELRKAFEMKIQEARQTK